MKKILLFLLVISILLSFGGCGNAQKPAEVTEPAESATAEVTESTDITVTEKPTETSTPVPTEQPEEIQPFDETVQQIIDDRLSAIQNKDVDLFMSAIGKNNQFYALEQDAWFCNMIEDTMSDWSFEIVSTEMVDERTAVAVIHQKHSNDGEDFDFEYPLIFRYEDGSWMDYGYNFEIIETDRFIIRYMEGETRVEEFQKYLEDAFDNLDKIYTEKPVAGYEIKLFSDIELLRQRSAPALPWVFTACSDDDESLRIFTGRPSDYLAYPGTVQHELVHNITIRICGNNLSTWMLEGIAMYDGSAYYGFETNSMLSTMSKEGVSQTIKHLEENDMYLDDDMSTEEIFNFYNTGYMYVKYIEETYGREKLMDIFYEAGKEPYHNAGIIDEEYCAINNEITENVILTVTGVSAEQLSQDYLEWLDTVDFDNLG